ncbi:hypothetical protein AW736_05990 [Termitidicoccus mucosus]|uniref:Uncharacterized protein n=2 Tax=Termitidicoccus mucosus TaxID=1184151 RepID=A0A178ILT2_9BACT|nr:hypothetical protein AW736_05990 [Opitutaceae bacterium TSB47]
MILSIVVNVVLFVGFEAGYISIKKSSVDGTPPKHKDSNVFSSEAAKATKALLTTDDMTALRDTLRTLGLPDDVAREIVKARIASRHTARLREIGYAALEAARQPYWRPKRNYTGGLLGYSSEQNQEMRDINREVENEVTQLFGTDKASASVSKYAFLPPEKSMQLSELESDYLDLKIRASIEMAGFGMPGDEEKLKLIDKENERDKLALLTPEEKEADELRNSSTARRMKDNLAGFDMSEEEYKAIFALRHALDEKFYDSIAWRVAALGGGLSELRKARDEEQKSVEARIKDMLGDARYAEYVRGQRQDYQSLIAAAERFNLGADTVAQTYQVRNDTASEAKRISDDAILSNDQKNAAYAALAEQASAQIKSALGDDVGDAYINNALAWLKNLPKGGNVKIDAKGNISVSQPKPASPPKK